MVKECGKSPKTAPSSVSWTAHTNNPSGRRYHDLILQLTYTWLAYDPYGYIATIWVLSDAMKKILSGRFAGGIQGHGVSKSFV